MEKIYIILILCSTTIGFCQTKTDTLYIEYNSNYEEMRQTDGFFSHPKLKSKDSLSFAYSIISHSRKLKHNITNMFAHHIIPDFVLKRPNNIIKYEYPIKKLIDSNFLKNKKVLDIHFFRKNSSEVLEKIFQGNDLRSLDDNPFVWLYDVQEIKNGKILLREVRHIKHHYE